MAYLSANHAALTPEMLNRLHAAAELEHRQNGECNTARPTPTLPDLLTPWCLCGAFSEDTLAKLTGTQVLYGQSIQLQHVKSGRFLTARPSQLAATEKDCTLLELDDRGDAYSRFTIMPRFKHRRYGGAPLPCVLSGVAPHSTLSDTPAGPVALLLQRG